jgi:hypothetical protein
MTSKNKPVAKPSAKPDPRFKGQSDNPHAADKSNYSGLFGSSGVTRATR